ncbi:DUF732 domain-containing protein [Mycobacterium scrofulaceum]|uniref:DUF732 domain-containing protein n=1 Tax=Mycobacterium scrofulaceum TaxID=1783 RepID=UPI003B0205FF
MLSERLQEDVVRRVRVRHGRGDDGHAGQTVVNAGHGVCQDWTNGATLAQTLADVKSALGLTDNNSGYFIGAATQSYCPQYVSKATQS